MSLQIGKTYIHYKGGLYVLECLGLHEDTHVPMVGYRSIKDGQLWFRPQEEFEKKFIVVTEATVKYDLDEMESDFNENDRRTV